MVRYIPVYATALRCMVLFLEAQDVHALAPALCFCGMFRPAGVYIGYT